MSAMNDTTDDGSMPLPKNDSLDMQIKFDLRPVWQSATYYYGHSFLKIIDEILPILTDSREHMMTGVGNSNVLVIHPRFTALIYFTGLLVGNFHPDSSEVDETIEKMEELFRNTENEAIKFLKVLKKVSSGINSFTKYFAKEIKHPNYKTFLTDERDVSEAAMFEPPIFQKHTGIWVELTNLENEALHLQCQEITSNGGMVRFPTEDLKLEDAVELGSLLLEEIQDSIQKGSAALAKIELTPEVIKGRKSTSTDFASSMKLIRKAQDFNGDNCAVELRNILTEIIWKLDIAISNRLRDLKSQAILVLKGIQCIRRRTGHWAPGQVADTAPQVIKYISPPRPKLSKILRCFQNRPEENPTSFVKMFSDIGNEIVEGTVLQVEVSETMKDILFKGFYGVTVDPCVVCESLSQVQHFAVIGLDAEQVEVDLEKPDADIAGDDEGFVIDKIDSVETVENAQSTNDQSSISGTIQRGDSQIELEEPFVSADEQKSDSAELPEVNVVENITTVNPGFEDDAVSTTSSSNRNTFQSQPPAYSESPGKSLKSEEKLNDNPSVEKGSTNEDKAQKPNQDKTHQGKAKPRGQYFIPDF